MLKELIKEINVYVSELDALRAMVQRMQREGGTICSAAWMGEEERARYEKQDRTVILRHFMAADLVLLPALGKKTRKKS